MDTAKYRPMRLPRMTYRQQMQRTRELDDLRIRRGLFPDEIAEADALHAKLYQRTLRAI